MVHYTPARGGNTRGFNDLIRRSCLVKQLNNFLRDEQGAELAEYAIGVAIIVAIALVVYRLLGSAVNTKMSTVANEVQK